MIEEQIFPLISLRPDGITCMGTGFFIEAGGGFVTAKHVLDIPERIEDFKMFGVQSLSNGQRLRRKVIHIHAHPDADVAIGRLGNIYDENGKVIEMVPPPVSVHNISLQGFKVGDKISSFGYPNQKVSNLSEDLDAVDFMGEWTEGEIIKYLDRTIWIPTPCFETSMILKGGHSGGPVLLDGYIAGVNNSGNYETSYVSALSYLLDLNVFVNGQSIPFKQIVEQGGSHHFRSP